MNSLVFDLAVTTRAKRDQVFEPICGLPVALEKSQSDVMMDMQVRPFSTNAALVPVTPDGFHSLLVPVLAVIRFPSTAPIGMIFSDIVFREPRPITLVLTKPDIRRFLPALFARVRFNSAVSNPHTGRATKPSVGRGFFAYLTGMNRDDAICFSPAFVGTEPHVAVRLPANFAGAGFGFTAGSLFLDPFGLSLWSLVFLAPRFSIALRRTIFLGGGLTTRGARGQFGCVAAILRAIFLLRPNKFLATLKTVGDLAKVKATTFIVTVKLVVRRQQLAAIDTGILSQLARLETFIRTELFGITRKGIAALLAPTERLLVRPVTLRVTEFLSVLGKGLATVKAMSEIFRHFVHSLMCLSLGFSTGRRSKETALSARDQLALAPQGII